MYYTLYVYRYNHFHRPNVTTNFKMRQCQKTESPTPFVKHKICS